MATNVEKWKLVVETKEAKTAMAGFEKRLGGMFDAGALKVAAYTKALDIAVGAMRAVGASMKQGFDDAVLFQRTTQQLSFTLKQLGDSGLSWLPTLQGIASETQRLTGVSDEVGRSLINMALNAGVSSDRVGDLMKASVRLSNTFDMDLKTATLQIIKSQTGLVTQTLKATGAVEGLSKAELEAGGAIDAINSKLESQLDVLTGGVAGGQMALVSAWADFNEELFTSATESEALQGTLNGVADSLNSITRAMASGDLITQFAKFAEVSTRLTAALMTLGLSEVTGAGGALGGAVDEQILNRQVRVPLPLVGLGAPAVGGSKPKGRSKGRGRGRGRGGKGGGGGFDFGAGGEQGLTQDDFAAADGDTFTTDAMTERLEARNELMLSLEQTVNDGLNEIHETNAQIRVKITNDEVDAKIKASKKSADEQAKFAWKGANMALGALNAFVEGGILGAAQYAAAQLQGVGMEMIGRGIADHAKAAAMIATVVQAPQGVALAAAATNEIAVGGALLGGGFGASLGLTAATGGFDNWSAMTGKGAAGGGGGGGGSGDLASQAQSDAANVQGRLGGGGGGGSSEPKQVTVILQGPVYDGAAAGVAISEAIAEANRQGF